MTDHDDREIREAFDRLREDTGKVDTMAAMRQVQDESRSMFGRAGVFAAAAVMVIAAIVGGVALIARDDGSTVVADDPDHEADVGSTLQGSAWVLVEGVGPDGPIPLVDGWPITLTFEGDSVGGRAACNGYGGTYSIDGSSLSIGEISWTAMGCEPDVAASEAGFLAALPAVDTIEIVDDRLQLTGEGAKLTFALEAPVPASDLVGQLWLLDTLIQGDTASSVAGDRATLFLDAEGNVSGGTGCRSFTGSYIINGGSVLFPSFGMQGECPAQLAAQDNLVVTVLGDGFTAEIDGDRLTLTSVGNEGLGYRAITQDETDPAVPERETISLSALLDERPEGDVDVEAYLVESGGGWFLCDRIDPLVFHRCSGRWLVATDVPDEIIEQFGPNELTDELGTWLATEEPVLVSGRLRIDDRFELTGSEDAAVLTAADDALLEAFIDVVPATPDVGALRLSTDGVTLGLGPQLSVERTAEQLTDPAQWLLDSDEFRGRVGPFSVLDVLGDATDVTTLVGPHSHCAAPPAVIPEELRDARQLSIQPTGIDSCLAWWTVDLFVDDGGDVVGVVFDTWEP